MADTPKIRFEGFMDTWEQRKLIDVCDYVDYRGKTPTKIDCGIFLVTAKNVKAGYIDYESSKEYISEDNYEEVMHRGKPKIGDVLITTEAPCGNVAQVDSSNIALAQRIIKYRGHKNEIDNTYLKHYMLAPHFQKLLFEKSSGGTVQGIKGSILHQQYVMYPRYAEQVKIGQYLDTLDHLITLHQRKCNETIELKKYMLKKMFPEEGREIPEIRFAGYTGAWERRKLGDMMFFSNGFNGSNESFGSGIALISVMDILNNDFITYDTIRGKAKVSNIELKRFKVEYGDVLFQRSSENVEDAGTSNVYLDTEKIAIFGGFVIRGKRKVNYDPVFIKYLLDSPLVRKQVVRKAQGAQHINVSQEMLQDIDILYPLSEEDVKIGNLLRCLDGTITFHQCKCNELKEVKKFMLQNMFPQKG